MSRHPRRYRRIKRTIDFLLSAAVLGITSPIWLLVAILIKRDDGGPVLYRGQRIGLGGKAFEMFKFRTMVVDAEARGGSSTANDDPRLTRTGAALRRWKLDELPQFVNVIKGEMSLVGPRPQVPVDVARYTDEELRLLTVPPGITDWSSIRFRNEGEILNGSDDPDRAYDELIRPEKSRLGLLYIERASVGTDVRILVQTALALAGREPSLPGASPLSNGNGTGSHEVSSTEAARV